MPPGHSQHHLVGQNSKQYLPGHDGRAINGGPVAKGKTAVLWTCLEDAADQVERHNLQVEHPCAGVA